MKIGILTTPLYYNYGGILQCYALQSFLKRNGYDATVIDIQYPKQTISTIAISFLKGIVKKYVLKKANSTVFDTSILFKNRKIISQNTVPFIDKNIQPKTAPIYGIKKLHKNHRLLSDFDAIIVGSDQVWRPLYCDVYTYFLGFIDTTRTKKISYAASFGVDNWEFTKEQTELARRLVDNFEGVSVREKSGIKLCKDHLKKDAIHVLDPTMLLKKEDYEKLIESPEYMENRLMVYVLDDDIEKKQVIRFVSEQTKLLPFVANNLNTENKSKPAKERIVPSIQSWLNGFKNAKFVITDSFHGTVFSILFNIPFIVFVNQERGTERFTSLLNMFGLSDRMVFSSNQLTDSLVNKPINWDKVNTIVDKERLKSTSFLTSLLNQ